jgi:hypothetical protein
MTDTKQYNLQELVTGLSTQGDGGGPQISEDMADLIRRGLHHVFLPDSLRPKAAESMQMAFEGIGGLPRLIQWADRNPSKFFNLFSRMIPATMAPVLPQEQQLDQVWPEWLSARRLAYQENAQYAEDVREKEANAEPDPE